MSKVRYTVAGGLTPEQLDQIHRTALRVIGEIGVEVGLPEILKRVAGQPGVKIEGTRVRLDAALVDRCVEESRARRTGEPDGGFTIDILTGFAFQVLDVGTDELRPMNTEDCIEAAKLVDSLHARGVRGGTPGLPQDVPPLLREILAYKIGCEYSRTAAHVGVTSMRGAEIVYEMSRAAGKAFHLPVFVLSPLRVEGGSIAMALEFLDRGLEVKASIHGMPLLGLTAPLPLPGAFVENIATVLAAYALFKLMGLGDELTYPFNVYPFDMKFGTIAYGTPRHVMGYLVGAQINSYYGASVGSCKAFHTNAIFADAHSIAQRASFAAVAALNGARNFTFGGMLGIDKIFSAEQLIVNVEIVDYVKHLVKGFDFGERALGYEAICEVGPGGDFLTHETTLDGYRDLWVSELFQDLSPEQWAAGERRALKERIRDRVAELLEGYDFCPDRRLRQELDRVYQAAVRELG